jgi:uncharacterized repeat protein (TIGR01451 family)
MFTAPEPAQASVAYTVTDLGTLGEGTVAYAINEAGQVAGVSQPDVFTEHGFRWTDGVMTGIHPFGGKRAYAFDLSDAGMVVGSANTSTGLLHAMYWLGQDPHDMGTLGGDDSEARAVGELRRTVGWSEVTPGSNVREAFLWAGDMIGLGTLSEGGDSIAEDINAQNVVVGRAEVAPNVWHAFVHQGLVMADLGTPSPNFAQSVANGINNDGVIVGQTQVVGGGLHPFVWTNGDWDVLTEIAGTAQAVNDHGTVVGESFTPAGEAGFVYQDGVLTNLNAVIPAGSGWMIGPAYDINEAGQIVGSGFLNGEGRGYLLTPTPPTADLALSMSAAPDPLLAGTAATFVASVANNGPDTATDVRISVQLPVNQTSASCAAPGGTCAGGGSSWTVTFASLASGSASSATFSVGSPVSAAHGAAYGASASVQADQADPDASNDQASASVTISNSADLAVSGSVDDKTAKTGQIVTYTFGVTNGGVGAAGSVLLADQLPSGLQLLSASSTTGDCTGSSAVSCSLGTMASGASATVTVRAQVTAGGGIRLVNTATVSSPNHDPVAGNNTASVSLNVTGKPLR